MKSVPKFLLVSWALLLVSSFPTFSASKGGAMLIKITKSLVAKDAGATKSISWITDEKAWLSSKPFFTIEDKGAAVANGWIGVSRSALRLHIVVNDKTHFAPDSFALWDGDCVEICIDARGDGTAGYEREREGLYGPDDIKVLMALAKTGPVANVFLSNDNSRRGPLPDSCRMISRDDTKGLTIYDLALPWTLLETMPGLYSSIGLSLQVDDLEPGMKDKVAYKWGEGTFGPFKPGLFNRFAIDEPPMPYAAVSVDNAIVWDRSVDKGKMVLSVRTDHDLLLSVGLDKEHTELTIGKNAALQRFDISLGLEAQVSSEKVPYTITISGKEKHEPLLNKTGIIDLPENTYAALLAKLDSLCHMDSHPLFLRHVRSVRSLVQTEWARLELYRASNPLLAEETNGFLKTILAGFRSDASSWDTYLGGKRALLFAFVSPTDRSMDYYEFTLPKNWDAQKKYPLFFELHGAGNAHPLSMVATDLDVSQKAMDLHGYESNKTYAQVQRNGYYCLPFGRGNLGYRGIAETDIWEAYDDVHRNFGIDQDRQYLYGFSMGGAGTLAIGIRTPDKWAAMAVLAGGMSRDGTAAAIAKNLSNIPVFLWSGEKDPGYQNGFLRIKELLATVNKTAVVKSTPGLGHTYIQAIQEEVVNWLQTHVRKRPSAFSYVADTDEHRGIWGITMKRDITVSPLPEFTCTVEGTTVKLDTKGTKSIQVVLGENGLGLAGNVTVVWNGTQAYSGSAKTIDLGEEIPPSMWH